MRKLQHLGTHFQFITSFLGASKYVICSRPRNRLTDPYGDERMVGVLPHGGASACTCNLISSASLTCRQRHLKCDKTDLNTGGCLRCQRSGRECLPVPAPVKLSFRHGQNPSMQKGHREPPKYGERDLTFATDQVWVRVPQTGINKEWALNRRI
jgi:hypothetical protein